MSTITKTARLATQPTEPGSYAIVNNCYPPPKGDDTNDQLYHTPQHRSKPHILPNGTYFNPWSTWLVNSMSSVLQWQRQRYYKTLTSTPVYKQSHIYKNNVDYTVDLNHYDDTLPVIQPEFATQPLPKSTIKYTWIGHATVLIQLGNINILTDPVFSKRVSPVSFMGPARYRPIPCTISELPPIDIVCISHNHYDHLDYPSITQLVKHNKSVGSDRVIQWILPTNVDKWFHSHTNVDRSNMTSLGWWNQYNPQTKQTIDLSEETNKTVEFATDSDTYKVTVVPAQHWSQRTPFDRNKSLWGGFVFEHNDLKVYYSGDTGYCPVFKQIYDQFGAMDFSVLPIGAYEPRWFMSPQHVDPQYAVRIHTDLHSKRSMAVHWGTFDLADEPATMPPSELRTELIRLGLNTDEFIVPIHGYTHTIQL